MSSSWEQQRIGAAQDAGLMELSGHVIVMGAAEDRGSTRCWSNGARRTPSSWEQQRIGAAQDAGLMELSGHAIVMEAAEDRGSTRCWSNGALRTCHRHGSSRGSGQHKMLV